MRVLLRLYAIFFKIGLVMFGGGLAMLPLLKKELAEKNKWVTEEEILDYYAIGQCTPGIIAVNCATFVGYKRYGVLGAVVATIGIVTPSTILISVLFHALTAVEHNVIVQHALAGVRIGVVALIIHTVIDMWKQNVKGWFSIGIVIVTIVLVGLCDISPIFVIPTVALVGLFLKREVPPNA